MNEPFNQLDTRLLLLWAVCIDIEFKAEPRDASDELKPAKVFVHFGQPSKIFASIDEMIQGEDPVQLVIRTKLDRLKSRKWGEKPAPKSNGIND